MLEAARNEGEIAGVLAHEISHVALRHGTAQASKATKYQLGELAGAVLGAIIGGRTGDVVAQGTSFGLGTAFLRFGRDFERQADLLGAQIMASAGYDPMDMANMFRTIEERSASGGPEWLSSHPNPGNRYEAISREAIALNVDDPIHMHPRLQPRAPASQLHAPGSDHRTGRWSTQRFSMSRQMDMIVPRPGADLTALEGRDAMPGTILWFTGLSGSGKSTLAHGVGERLGAVVPVEILDGDEVRTHLSKGLGFTKRDRDTNIARIAFVARLLAKHGVFVITAAISPYEDTRREMRRLAERDGITFVEVFTNATIEALVKRDVKGLYRRALAGEIQNFTGISDPYERPSNPDVMVRTDSESVDESVDIILRALVTRGVVPEPTA
jgi:adenylylsulfate kinase